MKTSIVKSAFVLASGPLFSSHLPAQPSWIDVDFNASTNGSGIIFSQATTIGYNPGAAGIGVAADIWNDIDISTPAYHPANLPATAPLKDRYINLTSVALTVSSGVFGVDSALPGTPVQNELFTPGFYGLNATLSGLTPGTTYDLLLYGPYATANVTVDGNPFPTWAAIGATWGPAWALGDGYNEMAIVAPPSGDLVINDPSTSEQITTLQIVAAPEPSASALAAISGVSLLAYRRRINKLNGSLPK